MRATLQLLDFIKIILTKFQTNNSPLVIFGDSTAGNSINSSLWEELSEEKTLNLALWNNKL